MDERAHDTAEKRTASGTQRQAPAHFRLRAPGIDVLLADGTYLVGRASGCHVRLESPLVSRRHARLRLRGDEVTIEDLGSRNGVRVNGADLHGTVTVRGRTEVEVGHELVHIEVQPPMRDADFRSPAAQTGSRSIGHVDDSEDLDPLGSQDPEESTLNTDGFLLLSGVVDKMLALGRAEDAERLVAGHLAMLLEEARSGVAITAEACAKASEYAAKLAAGTTKGRWIDYAFDLYANAEHVMPMTVVDLLFGSVRKAPNVNRRKIRGYIELVEGRAGRLTPPERFALQRIEGLERLAAHL